MNKKFFPVIHVQDAVQALENAAVAFECGADGIFLINHEDEQGHRPINYLDLLSIHTEVVADHPGKWIGINFLDLPATKIFQHLTPAVAGVWIDDGEIDERTGPQPAAEAISIAREGSGWQGVYLGGVAFKYQRSVAGEDLAKAAEIGARFIDVVTTSGPATGKAAAIEKVQTMKRALGAKPLAIASGITVENVNSYLAWVDYFLVATGISSDFYTLDPQKVKALATIIHQANNHPA